MARSFNGANPDHIDCSVPISAGPATVFCWIKPTSTTGVQTGIGIGASGAGQSFVFLGTNGAAWLLETSSSIGNTEVASGGTVTANAWTPIAGTIGTDSTTVITLYVGGSTFTSSTATGTYSFNLFQLGVITSFALGANSDHLTGSLADCAVWNVQLTAAEITALTNGARPYTIRPSALKIWLPLDGLQSPEPDLSGMALNGTLTGTSLAAGPPFMQLTPRWPIFTAAPIVSSFQAAWAMRNRIVVDGIGI